MLKHHYSDMRAPARVVILGAGGFIAGEIIEALAGKVPTLQLGRPSFDLLAHRAPERLAAALRPEDVLVFASAHAPCKDPGMLRTNIEMAEAVCNALRAQSVAHVVYLSSDAVYKDSVQPLTEASCAEPASLHGVMHLAREVALRSTFNGPLAIVRPTLMYGLKDPHNGYGPNRFRRLAAAGKDITLFGEGEERRDHVDVQDVAELVRLIIMRRSDGVANAASGEVVSFRELASFAASDFTPCVSIVASPRSGPMPHNGYRAFDIRAIAQAFPGFRFKPWREGLAAVHAAFKKEPAA